LAAITLQGKCNIQSLQGAHLSLLAGRSGERQSEDKSSSTGTAALRVVGGCASSAMKNTIACLTSSVGVSRNTPPNSLSLSSRGCGHRTILNTVVSGQLDQNYIELAKPKNNSGRRVRLNSDAIAAIRSLRRPGSDARIRHCPAKVRRKTSIRARGSSLG
jgi:hypothetical protein